MTRSEKNKWLKALHEAMGPEFFAAEYWHSKSGAWFRSSTVWFSYASKYRLRPIVPEGCEPIPDECYVYGPDLRGAVCLQGPLKDPAIFAGWIANKRSMRWVESGKSGLNGMVSNGVYLVRLTDPNAPEIVRRNTGRRLPWDDELTPEECLAEMTRIAQETGQYDQPNSITIKADRFEVETKDGELTVGWW